MAGGRWTRQNKIRPGAYINFRGKRDTSVPLGERGTASIPLVLPWGPEKKIVEVNIDDDLLDVLGISITDKAALLIREALKKAKTLLIYRLNIGDKAKATLTNLTVTAKYSGIKGNKITIVIQKNIDDPTLFEVITLFEGSRIDLQVVRSISELKSNSCVEFSGTGDLQATSGLILNGGTDGIVTNSDYTDYLTAVELFEFNTIGITSKDASIKAIVTNFVKRLREQDGRAVQVVLENYPEADYEGVISVKNGVILPDEVINCDKAVAFVTGATAGAGINKSNTYAEYDGAIDVDIKYTNKEIEKALKNGEIVFTKSNGRIIIEQDVNTLKTFTNDKTKDFRKNRVMRVLDSINNTVKLLWEIRYTGKGDNNVDGRNLFKKDIIKTLELMQKMNALENVVPEDVIVERGDDKDSVITMISVQPVDAMEKLYMDVEVR